MPLLFVLSSGCGLLWRTSEVELRDVGVTIPEQLGNGNVVIKQGIFYRWWEKFNDSHLNSIVAKVEKGNLDLRQLLAKLEQEEARQKIASASFWPQFDLTASADRSRLNLRFSEGSFGGLDVSRPTNSNFQLSIPVSYEVDLWGRIRYAARASEQEVFASKQDYHSALLSVVAEVIDTYVLVAGLCEQIDLLDETIRSDRNFQTLVKARYVDGIANPLDVHQARQNLASDLARKPLLLSNVSAAKRKLKILIGEYPSSKGECDDYTLPRSDEVLPNAVSSQLVLSRPDVRSALHRLRAADARVGEAVAARFPGISLRASGSYAGVDIAEVLTPESLIWRLAAELGLTLFDGGRKRARVDLQSAIFEEAKARFVKTVLTAFQDVENVLTAANEQKSHIKLLKSKRDAVLRSLNLSTEQYLQGVKDYLPVLASRVEYYSTRSELLSANRQLLSQYVQLTLALGEGWSEDELFSNGQDSKEEHHIQE